MRITATRQELICHALSRKSDDERRKIEREKDDAKASRFRRRPYLTQGQVYNTQKTQEVERERDRRDKDI